jgi:FKBP-type peptidyl-prolyl cis-trans isomerase SlpA
MEYGGAKEGQVVLLQNDRGEQLPAQIVQVGPETVTVDLNHPLAGHPINFEVELLELLDNPE